MLFIIQMAYATHCYDLELFIKCSIFMSFRGLLKSGLGERKVSIPDKIWCPLSVHFIEVEINTELSAQTVILNQN